MLKVIFPLLFTLFFLFFSNCGDPYSKEEFMNLGKSGSSFSNVLTNTTIIIASSDSPISKQTGANAVISTNDDAGFIINSKIKILNDSGGGTIQLTEGTYNVSTRIIASSNVNLFGTTNNTRLKRNSNSLTQVIYIPGNVSNIIFKEFSIDGNGTNYPVTGNSYGIYCEAINSNTGISYNYIQSNNNIGSSFGTGFYCCSSLNYCIGSNNEGSSYCGAGFSNCNSLSNCTGNNNSSNNYGLGFALCTSLDTCTGNSNTSANYCYGFYQCTLLTDCTGNNNSSSNDSFGFYGCSYLSDCKGNCNIGSLHGIGFNNCTSLVACNGNYNNGSGSNGVGIGFSGCTTLNKCIGNNNCASSSNGNGYGFYHCITLTSCISNSNSGSCGYGYAGCTYLQQNIGTGNIGSGNFTSLYNTCYIDNGIIPVQ